MKNLSPFQIILFVVAGIAIIAGVFLFAFKQQKSTTDVFPVTMWGTVDYDLITGLTDEIILKDRDSINLTYTQISDTSFEKELVEALAEGRGPDMVILPEDLIVKHRNKLFTIGYDFFDERSYKDTFIEEGEIFLKNDGIIAFPLMIDPMIMYWNRTLFTNASISQPPRYWDQVVAYTPKLTSSDSSFNIFRSAVALGEFQNVLHAKSIFTTLLLQSGNKIVSKGLSQGIEENIEVYNVILDENLGYQIRPAEAALSFFTQFANPARDVYTWNRSLPKSQEMFVAGDLAVYFGFASEYNLIRQKNPNLNFDIALMPQSRSGTTDAYGKMYGVAITKNSNNVAGAFDAITRMTDPDILKALESKTFLPPVRRDLISDKPNDAVMSVFYDAAIRSKGVFDIDPIETERIYKTMVESFISGRLNISEAVDRAATEMRQLLGI